MSKLQQFIVDSQRITEAMEQTPDRRIVLFTDFYMGALKPMLEKTERLGRLFGEAGSEVGELLHRMQFSQAIPRRLLKSEDLKEQSKANLEALRKIQAYLDSNGLTSFSPSEHHAFQIGEINIAMRDAGRKGIMPLHGMARLHTGSILKGESAHIVDFWHAVADLPDYSDYFPSDGPSSGKKVPAFTGPAGPGWVFSGGGTHHVPQRQPVPVYVHPR